MKQDDLGKNRFPKEVKAKIEMEVINIYSKSALI